MTNLRALLDTDQPNMGEIRSYLDSLDHPTRLAETRTLGKLPQKRLYEAAQGFQAVDLDYLVPASTPAMQEVVHHGKNTLPVFSHFAKVFTRGEGVSGELWGYNRNSSFVETVVGPGYYVAYPHSAAGEVLVDYLRQPPTHPAGWPPIIPNSARLSRFVYNGTQDILRGVSKHVTIGLATRNGEDLPNWFILCREDR